VPPGLEEAVCALANRERAFFSCPVALAGSGGASGGPGVGTRGGAEGGSLVPPPPPGTDRVEFELHLLSMLQVLPLPASGRNLAMHCYYSDHNAGKVTT